MKYKIYFGPSMAFFGENAIKHLGFEKFNPLLDQESPVLFLGLYNEDDYNIFEKHNGPKAIFWNGNDVRGLLETPEYQCILQKFPRTKHATHNQFLLDELELVGVKAIVASIFFSGVENYKESYDPSAPFSVYLVAHPDREEEYGVDVVRKLAAEMPDVRFNVFGVRGEDTKNLFYHGAVDERIFDQLTSKMHVCLRLNDHDGLSQTVIKAALRGHHVVSKIGYSFAWSVQSYEDIKDFLSLPPKNKPTDYEHVADFNLILNDFDWLEKKKNDLALVMVVKDEEKGLENAILSCVDLVDEIVISVDSKSTDKTLDIAKKYADVVKIHEWRDDFSAARNSAHHGVNSKWILFLDGHEFVKNQGGIIKALEQDVEGIMVQVEMEDGYSFYYPRIYRSGLSFTGAVHNLVEVKTSVKCSDFVIQHDRENFQGEAAAKLRTEQRNDMVPRVMGERLKKNKKDIRALFYLAIHAADKKNFKLALKCYKKYLKYSTQFGERWQAYFNCMVVHHHQEHSLRALWCIARAEREMPGRWETSHAHGVTYMSMKNWQRAVEFLVDSLKENTQKYAFNPIKKNYSEIWDYIGTCFFHLRQFKECHSAWKRGSDLCKDDRKKGLFTQRLALVKMVLEHNNQ